MPSDDEGVERWQSLPRRVYLDTTTLQHMWVYGDVLWENEPYQPTRDRLHDSDLAVELEALRLVFTVNERAQFEFAVTEASLSEVERYQHQPGYQRWVRDVLDVWLVQSAGEPEPERADLFSRYSNISQKDRLLLQDAVDYDCDGFLTMEKNLPRQAKFIKGLSGLLVMRPTGYQRLLAPWAALYL